MKDDPRVNPRPVFILRGGQSPMVAPVSKFRLLLAFRPQYVVSSSRLGRGDREDKSGASYSSQPKEKEVVNLEVSPHGQKRFPAGIVTVLRLRSIPANLPGG